MVAAVDDVHVNIDHRIAADDAIVSGFVQAFDASGNVLFGDVAADNLVLDGDSLAARIRRNLDNDVPILAATTRLLDQLTFAIGRNKDRLLVGDLRLAGVRLDLELPKHAVSDNLEV